MYNRPKNSEKFAKKKQFKEEKKNPYQKGIKKTPEESVF